MFQRSLKDKPPFPQPFQISLRKCILSLGLLLGILSTFSACGQQEASYKSVDPILCLKRPPLCSRGQLICRPNGSWKCIYCIDGERLSCDKGDSKTRNVRPCKSGVQICKDGQWSIQCKGEVLPTTELCGNGLDDDCDGKSDENCNCTPRTTQACGTNIGLCKKGVQKCLPNGVWSECLNAKKQRKEVCDGHDNDCDGDVDENLAHKCQTNCGKGRQVCKQGTWLDCNAPKPSKEICDNKDNDCNGVIDGLFRSCSGSCGSGIETCASGRWDRCNIPKPSKEVCDKKDNDCDGIIDEGLSRKCKHKCGTGKQVCDKGNWTLCSSPQRSKEVCDNKDNDCDGTIDGFSRKCKHKCGTGKQVCDKGKWGLCSSFQVNKEICDNKDNDCDGTVDGFSRECKSLCGLGKELCTNGTWGSCVGKRPQKEICDGRDNDCDGKIDNQKSTRLPISQPCTWRRCLSKKICANSQWSRCQKPNISREVCDGKDNNCDGKIDNIPKGAPLCDSQKGICERKRKKCVNAKWTNCNVRGFEPKETSCNDKKDNDCDGKKDQDEENCP